jgi:Helix-turn-helix domain
MEKIDIKTLNQYNRVFYWLASHGEINPMTAWKELGVYRLSAVIFKIRKDGYDIKSETTLVKNKFGEKCNVARYIWQEQLLGDIA